ncbi:MAG: hypothetical protein CSA38_00665 [Flavobacteriales bacterium]|nr:MAG: hypothetical protein CSA38_00665 [Flavobacteriales bacterium]
MTNANAQIDSSLLKRVEKPTDSLENKMNMDAIYNRPMLSMGKAPVNIGGYLESNWQHLGEDGVSEGHQFQFRRLTMFMSSAITKRINFMSEIEFEEGGKEINIEFAAVDVNLHPLLNLRGGIIVNPIGSFNQNHDGPKWEFTDRPISSTQMLPATWSTAGFGLYGKYHMKDWSFGYEAYLSGGFNSSIIDNEEQKTFLGAAKDDAERFEESVSGEPLYTGKIALKNKKIGELGLSYMGGAYNNYSDDGLDLEERKTLSVYAVDFNTTIPKLGTFITTEWAWVNVEMPENYTQQYGNKQFGGFVDIVQPLIRRKMLGWKNASINLACRLDYVDWNIGKFKQTGGEIGDETWSVMGGLSFRPTPQTVLRLNYRHQSIKDILNNPPAKLGGFSFGISTYF